MYRKIKKQTGILMDKRYNVFIIRRLLRANQDILDNVPFRVSEKGGKLIVVPYSATEEKINKLRAELTKNGLKCIVEGFIINVKL